MQNEMRDRLIRALCSVECVGADRREGGCALRKDGGCVRIEGLEMCMVETIADHLLSVGVIAPPVEIGDEVLAIVEDENRIVSILHYTVEGLMYRGGKYYACGSDGDFNEVGTRLCLPPKYLDRQAVLGGLTGGVHGESEGA